jgi:hypothetical protein
MNKFDIGDFVRHVIDGPHTILGFVEEIRDNGIVIVAHFERQESLIYRDYNLVKVDG